MAKKSYRSDKKNPPIFRIVIVPLVLAAFVMSLVAITSIPNMPTMGSETVSTRSTKSARATPKCPFGGEMLVWYVDRDADGQFNPLFDTLLFEQEICETQQIERVMDDMSFHIDMVNQSIWESVEDHVEFRAKDQILENVTHNLDNKRLEMESTVAQQQAQISAQQSDLLLGQNDRQNIRHTLDYIGARTTVLEEKDLHKYQRLMNLDTNVTTFNQRITVLEAVNHVTHDDLNMTETELIDYLVASNNQTAQKLDAFTARLNEDEYNLIEHTTHIDRLRQNFSEHEMDLAIMNGRVQGIEQNISVIEVWRSNVNNQFNVLFSHDITLGDRIDRLQLNATELRNDLNTQNGQLFTLQSRITQDEQQTNSIATQFAVLQSVVGIKIQEFELVKGNQTSMWQRILQEERYIATIDGRISTMEMAHTESKASYLLLKEELSQLSSLTQTLPNLNETVLEALGQSMSVANQTQYLSQQLGIIDGKTLRNCLDLIQINHTANNNVADITSVTEQINVLSGVSDTYSLRLGTIESTLGARGILINTTLVNSQLRLGNIETTMADHETRIVSLEMENVNQASATAMNTANIDTILSVQDLHNAQLANLAQNNSEIDEKHHALKLRTVNVEQSTHLLNIDTAQLKVDVEHLRAQVLFNSGNQTEIDILQNLTRIDAKLTQLERRIFDLENAPTSGPPPPPPTPSVLVPEPTVKIMHGYVHDDGTVAHAYKSDVIRTGVGRYTIVFDEAQSTNTYSVFLQVEEEHSSSTAKDDIQLHVISTSRTTNSVSIHAVRQDRGGKNIPYEDRAFSYQIICLPL